MGKHTQNCTLIGKGVYGTIGVDQRSRLADGAHFHTMIVTSTLEASVIEGDKLVIKSGIVRCDGDIRVSSISGSGDIEVGGDIICDEITFTGKLRCNGDIVCSGNLSVNGSLGTRHISGQTVRLNGVLKGHDVNSRALEVHPLRSTMFSRFDMDGYEDGSTVRHITAVTVEANHLQCRTLTADSAMLRNGSAVESATCATALGIDPYLQRAAGERRLPTHSSQDSVKQVFLITVGADDGTIGSGHHVKSVLFSTGDHVV